MIEQSIRSEPAMRRKLPSGLTEMQSRAARMLGLGHSQRATAARIGLSPDSGDRTIRRWLEIPAFRAARDAAQEESTDPTILQVLHELLNDQDPRIRLGAAQELNRMGRDPDGEPSPTTAAGRITEFT